MKPSKKEGAKKEKNRGTLKPIWPGLLLRRGKKEVCSEIKGKPSNFVDAVEKKGNPRGRVKTRAPLRQGKGKVFGWGRHNGT